MKISLSLAVYNEEKNIHYPLDSCISWVDEVIIVDGGSTDKTVKIARSYGKKVKIFIHKNPFMFHINKQKALDYATGDWILQLDADEEISSKLALEIQKIIKMSQKEIEEYQKDLPERELFLRNQRLIEEKSGPVLVSLPSVLASNNTSRLRAAGRPSTSTPDFSQSQKYVAFYLPRLNFFLGKFLRYGGLYPDGSIRLIKKGKGRFPCRDVHEVMEFDGKVGWLKNPILHYDSPTFKRYIERNNRYVNLLAEEIKNQRPKVKNTNKNLKLKKTLHASCFAFQVSRFTFHVKMMIDWVFVKPISWFLMTTFVHKGILDGWRGVVFSLFSALRFPRAYLKYLSEK